MGFWDTLQQISGEMNATALPNAALQLATDRLCETPVGIADHQLDPSEAALLSGGDEFRPEALAFAIAHLEA